MTESLCGVDISKILSEEGAIVKCVILRCAADSRTNDVELDNPNGPLIEEIQLDTTPRKSMVAQTLGGDFTFLGQYEDEGIVLMIRRPEWNSNEELPPVNPHVLQPPFHNVQVRGDILLMKVADFETELELEEESEGEEEKSSQKPSTKEEFFLDYTKEDYLKFASRTDIVWKSEEEEDDEEISLEEDQSSDDEIHAKPKSSNDSEINIDILLSNGQKSEEWDEHDEEFDVEAEEEEHDFDTDEHQVGMMNLILGQILRRFHEENGRGPNTRELLDMRKALADQLGVPVPEVDEEACNWDKKIPTPKRHNKKVVVAEDKNECETIPRAHDHALLVSQSLDQAVREENVTSENGKPDSVKRSAAVIESDERISKKAKRQEIFEDTSSDL